MLSTDPWKMGCCHRAHYCPISTWTIHQGFQCSGV
jgi:hypothetical protein